MRALSFDRLASRHPASTRRRGTLFLLLCLGILLASCAENMRNQARYEPLEASDFFADGQASRPVEPNTVARGQLNQNAAFYTGREGDQLVRTNPMTITRELLVRGRQRYEVFCTPCHGLVGDGQGMIVQRGFPAPPTFHSDRLRQAPDGHFFDAITNGFGRMFSYAQRVPVEDRWAIVAYIRALQRSQNATIDDVPPEERSKLQGGP